MHIEYGDFSTLEFDCYRRVSAVVTIPATAWQALEIGEHESTERVTPCFAWCVDRFGPGGERWIVRFQGDATVRILFRDTADAMVFHAAWSLVEPGRAAPLAA